MSHEPSVASPVKGIQDRIRIQFRMFLLWFVFPNIKSVSRQAGRYRQHQCLMRLDPVSGSFEGDIHIFSGTPRQKNAMISHHIAVKQTLEESCIQSQTVRNTFLRWEVLQISINVKYCHCHVCDSCSGNRFNGLSDFTQPTFGSIGCKKKRNGAPVLLCYLCSPVYTEPNRPVKLLRFPGDGPGHCQIAASLVVHPFLMDVYECNMNYI